MMPFNTCSDRSVQLPEYQTPGEITPPLCPPTPHKRTIACTQDSQTVACSSPKTLCSREKENGGSQAQVNGHAVEHNSSCEVPSGCGRRKRRKPLHPQKSPSLWDPEFRGVTLCFHTVVRGSSSELIITPIYSKNLSRLQRRHRRVRFNSESEIDAGHSTPEETSTSCDELRIRGPSTPLITGVKSCASCSTRRTPLWRDAEDGTPLCNACGIRYRKYRIRCSSCWHIPRKDNKVFPACSQCGGVLRVSQAKKC